MSLNLTTQIRVCIESVQNGFPSRSHHSQWDDDVRSVVADIEKLNRSTEADFLAVGGNLMSYLSASRQLHADIAGLTALVSGEHAQHACNALVSVHSYVQEMQQGSEESGRSLLVLQASAERIRRGFIRLLSN